MVASGSSDGLVRFWRADLSGRGCASRPVGSPGQGFVNGLAFSPDGVSSPPRSAASIGSGAGGGTGRGEAAGPRHRRNADAEAAKEAVDAESEQGREQ